MIRRNQLIALFGFVLTVVSISFLWSDNILLFSVLGIVLLGLHLSWREKGDEVMILAGLILGSVFDIIIVRSGAWTFTNPSYAGVPIWLPLAWMIGAICLLKVYKSLQ